MARHDPLTGAYNRHCLDELLDIETRRSKRYTGTIGFLMMDINCFKTINDSHGHQTATRCSKRWRSCSTGRCVTWIMWMRYGGDEFLLIMPQTATETELVKRRIGDTVKVWNKTDSPFDFPVTLSIGSAHWARKAEKRWKRCWPGPMSACTSIKPRTQKSDIIVHIRVWGQILLRWAKPLAN